MVDYSRWDNLDLSDEEEKPKPRVHAFKGPQQVTIGAPGSGGQVLVTPSASANDGPEDMEEDDGDEPVEPPSDDDEGLAGGAAPRDRREDVLQLRALAERALRSGEAHEAVRLLEKAMRSGGAQCPGLEDVLASAKRQAAASGGGAAGGGGGAAVAQASGGAASSASSAQAAAGGVVEGRYAWTQTRETVEVNVFVPDGTKAKTVTVDIAEERVRLSAAGAVLLEGQWEFKVEPDEDPDWEVRDDAALGRRVLRLTVRKKEMPGGLSVVVWWKRVLKGDPGIDVSKIEGRKAEHSESFAKAWKEAHVQFKEKAQHRVPIPIDVSGGAGAGDAMED